MTANARRMRGGPLHHRSPLAFRAPGKRGSVCPRQARRAAVMSEFVTVIIALIILLLILSVRMAQEYQRAVIFRLGRLKGHRGPGLYLLIPLLERQVTVDLRTITQQLDTQETLSSDGVAVKVNAVLWFRAADPERTIVAGENWKIAVKQAVETGMRDTIGQSELDGLLRDRLSVNARLLEVLRNAVQRWGVEIEAVALKDRGIPEQMQRAIAREAEAIREKRARIIKAEGR